MISRNVAYRVHVIWKSSVLAKPGPCAGTVLPPAVVPGAAAFDPTVASPTICWMFGNGFWNNSGSASVLVAHISHKVGGQRRWWLVES